MAELSTRGKGWRAEGIACEYLAQNGYKIVGRNIYLSHKEIDIIAEDDNFIVFVEVKSRRTSPNTPDRFGRPANAVSYRKRQNVISFCDEYLRQNPSGKQPRIDVIEVYITNKSSCSYEIRHIRNAFGI